MILKLDNRVNAIAVQLRVVVGQRTIDSVKIVIVFVKKNLLCFFSVAIRGIPSLAYSRYAFVARSDTPHSLRKSSDFLLG